MVVYLNQPFFFDFTSGEVLILGGTSALPLIIIKGTIAHKAKNNIQNK